MAMLFNLYSCDETQYPSFKGVPSNELAAFIGQKVYIQNDPTKVYTVGRMVSAAMPEIAFTNSSATNTFTITSIKLNDVEQLLAPQSTTIVKNFILDAKLTSSCPT